MQPEINIDELNDDSPISSEKSLDDVHIDDLLRVAAEKHASDLHIAVGLPPMVRLDGSLARTEFRPLSPSDTQRLIYDILNNEQIEKFERMRELDFSYGVKSVGRFRVNVYKQRGSVGAALRAIPDQIPSF